MTAAFPWGRRSLPISPKGVSDMCLAIPARVKSIDGQMARVEVAGVGRQVSLSLTPEARVGDYVLLHTGYAISVIDAEEARETLELLRQMSEVR